MLSTKYYEGILTHENQTREPKRTIKSQDVVRVARAISLVIQLHVKAPMVVDHKLVVTKPKLQLDVRVEDFAVGVSARHGDKAAPVGKGPNEEHLLPAVAPIKIH